MNNYICSANITGCFAVLTYLRTASSTYFYYILIQSDTILIIVIIKENEMLNSQDFGSIYL